MFSSSENRGGKNEDRVMRSRCILRPALVLHIKPSWMQFLNLFLSFSLSLVSFEFTARDTEARRISLSLFPFFFFLFPREDIAVNHDSDTAAELFEVSGRKISCHRVRDRIEMKNLYEVILFFFFFSLEKLEFSWSPWKKKVLFHLSN